MTACYFTNIGPTKGPLRYRDVPGAIGVLESPDNPMPIGMAMCRGWDRAGLAVWTLTIRGADVPGRWIIVDREFRTAEIPSDLHRRERV
jgi:hypothetical protein